MDTTVALALAAILGWIVGGFLHAMALRIGSATSCSSPPPPCTTCGARPRPIGWNPLLRDLFRGGKCRYGEDRLAKSYLIVEAATSLLFVLMVWKFGVSMEAATGMSFVSILVPIVITDLKAMIIPNRMVLVGLAGMLLLRMISHPLPWWHYMAGMAGGLLLIGAVAGVGSVLLRKEAIGMGDAKLFALVGLVLGWKLTLLTLFIASLLNTVFGLAAIALKRSERSPYLPFGPSIALASVIGMYAGDAWIEGYVELL
jgi:leader peptidase (prepilin peptidase) / N-methyltransferase